MIKHVLLDLDDTVLDFLYAEECSLRKTLVKFGIEPKGEYLSLYSRINKECWEALERREMRREEVLVKRFERLFKEIGVRADAEEIKECYEENLSDTAFMMEGAMELLDRLAKEDFTLSLASNGTARVQDRRIAKAGFAHMFDNIFISERLGADKPSKRFFDECMRALGNPDPKEVVIVGDSLTSDIAGGVKYGIHTIHFNRHAPIHYGDIKPEFVAKSLEDIPGIIKNIK